MTGFKVLDTELLNGYFESLGKEMLAQMFTLYREKSPLYMQTIADAIESGSQNNWHESCHKMKGAASSAGLCYIQQHLKIMESEKGSSSKKQLQLAELYKINSQSMCAFEAWLDAL